MNEDLKAAQKFNNISLIIFMVFFIMTITLIPFFAYKFNNYWLLFGILFSLLGYYSTDPKPIKLFYILTFAIIVYWFSNGFKFSEPITFFWFSLFTSTILKTLSLSFKDLGKEIISMKISDINNQIKNNIKH